ncbi:uncharacterized protein LOC106644696 isoform X2 [Copidosoma floridanum]|uniref:uncharacterized protein LOC106644696 isoform X2 n=1 Tax=Copidosoma floridanum TaxID=29053 RepID=UPI0006C94384|nr:uncharacterized protein LOC106644696 isoform X2 [Copidosoma floridanum]
MAYRTGLFALILLADLLLRGSRVFAIDQQRWQFDDSSSDTAEKYLCNFNEPKGTYNATDLILCMNSLASMILLQRNFNSNRMTDRVYQDSGQSYPTYLDYSSVSGATSNHFNGNMLTSLLPGTLPLTSLADFLGSFTTLTRPGFNLFGALSSIAQYDDLKCVPRILCEIASGSMPGSAGYRQNSGYQDFQKSPILSLLSAFDVGGSSPILSFGRAALLGYTNMGHSSMCYHEYPRCPRRQDQLISYLNNHKGGFFRLFSSNRDSYNVPQQPAYRPYYRKPSNELEYRIVGSDTEDPTTPLYLRPEADRTGTGKLSFANSDFQEQDSNNANFFPTKSQKNDFTTFTFPKENEHSYHQLNPAKVLINEFNENQRDPLRKDRRQKL